MKFQNRLLRVGIVTLFVGIALVPIKTAVAAGAPQLVISQFKVTTSDGQFFTLYNPSASNSVNLSGFELEYFNNNDLTQATSSKLIPLSGTLAPQSYYMLSDGASAICYQMTVDTVSLGFSTTSGFAEVLQLPQQTTAGDLILPTVTDYVGWSKSTSKGNDTLKVSPAATSVVVPSGTSLSWLRQQSVPTPGAGAWQAVRPDPANQCSMQAVQTGAGATVPPTNPGNLLTTGQQAPATIVSLASDTSAATGPVLPSEDIGLAAPQITELLPNPDGTGNDDTDEFIELYNPNSAEFHLIGFTLQTGTTTKHSYVFPDGTILPAQSFTAFYSGDTGLSLSNTSGQADLLDPFGNPLSQTDAYGAAKDGQAWSLANGKWYWTAQATPNAANVIKQTSTASKTASKPSSSKNSSSPGSVKGASTTAANTLSSAASGTETAAPAPIHPYVLAAVAVLAVGYGVYEYRHDLGNWLHRLRRDRTARRIARA